MEVPTDTFSFSIYLVMSISSYKYFRIKYLTICKTQMVNHVELDILSLCIGQKYKKIWKDISGSYQVRDFVPQKTIVNLNLEMEEQKGHEM